MFTSSKLFFLYCNLLPTGKRLVLLESDLLLRSKKLIILGVRKPTLLRP
jgi:hypothetical protein